MFLFSCKCDKEYNQFTSEELSWVPYEIGDTLKFRSNLKNEEKWVITNKEIVESNYGYLSGMSIGSKECHLTYYSYYSFDIYRMKDSTNHKISLTKNDIIEQENHISTLNFYKNHSKESLNNIETTELTEYGQTQNLITIQFKKAIGLFSYKIKDSDEIYEKH